MLIEYSMQVNSSYPLTTVSLLNDGYRLLLAHFPTITAGAPRIAQSVLPFAPRTSKLTSTYPGYADTSIQVIHGAELNWSPCLMTLKGHSAEVMSVTVSQDGSRIATGSDDGEICVWDGSSGDIITSLKGHADDIQSVAFSPDGHQVVSGSWDGSVRLWGIASGTLLLQLEGHLDVVLSVAVSSKAGALASGSGDHSVRVWDPISGKCTCTLTGHSGPVRCVSFFPDEGRLVSGSDDNTLRVWDVLTKTCITELQGHKTFVTSVSVSSEGSGIASGSADCDIMLWPAPPPVGAEPNARTPPRLTLRGHEDPVNSVMFSQDGGQLVSGSSDHTIRLWETSTGRNVAVLEGHGGPVKSVAFSPEGRSVVSGGTDQTVKIWTAVVEDVLASEERSSIISMALSPDGTRIVSLSSRLIISVRNTSTGDDILSFQLQDLPFWASDKKVNFSLDGIWIIIKFVGHPIQVFNASSGERLANANDHSLEEYYPSQDSFTVVGENLMLRGSSRSKPICVFAPDFSVRSMISTKLPVDETRYCIALVRGDGRLVILHVVL